MNAACFNLTLEGPSITELVPLTKQFIGLLNQWQLQLTSLQQGYLFDELRFWSALAFGAMLFSKKGRVSAD